MSVAVPAGLVFKGQATYTDLSSAVELADTPTNGVALPDGANCAIINQTGDSVYLSLDGSAADSTAPQFPATLFLVENDRQFLTLYSALEVTGGAALNIWYFQGPGG